MISVNGKTVLKGTMRWLNELMQDRIDKVIPDKEFIESFSIDLGSHKVDYDVINGLIGRILMQDIHPDGFKQIAFNGFWSGVDELTKDVIDRLVD